MLDSRSCDCHDAKKPGAGTAAPSSNLEKYLDRPVKDLVAAPEQVIAPPLAERHQIFALLLMAITRWYWNGNKRGRHGVYHLNPSEAAGDIGNSLGSDYLGHNIAGLAVDCDGLVIDFDFNHNEIFNSSAEHAEARLVRRVFSLVQVEDSWNVNGSGVPPRRGNMIPDVTIYTTLESCAQCSGVMALATVKQVVYLQHDPGMYHIGNVLWRLTDKTDLPAPLPITGGQIGLPYFKSLNERFAAFVSQQSTGQGPPFFTPTNGHDEFTTSLTSFLCTRSAYSEFKEGECAFDALTKERLKFPSFKPMEHNLTNAECLDEATKFRTYATTKGCRGTPHK
jgi:tRNA(Arg) A34 adenosine deaminase TadA